MLRLIQTYRTDGRLLESMAIHYSQPKGFVGRNICYTIYYNNQYYGHIVGGSATKNLKERDNYFPMNSISLDNIINNLYYHVEPRDGKYPCRNFTTKVIKFWRETIEKDWYDRYGYKVEGFETLIELPRLGECYRRDNWHCIGITKGYTCKRSSGKGTDSWSGKRVWNTIELRPKRILVRDA